MFAEMTSRLLPICDRCGHYREPPVRLRFDGQGYSCSPPEYCGTPTRQEAPSGA